MKKTRTVNVDSAYATLIGSTLIEALQSKGVIRPGGKAVVTITLHLPEEDAGDLEGDALLTAKLADIVMIPKSISTALADYSNIFRVYQLISLTEKEFHNRRMVGPQSIRRLQEFFERFGFKVGTTFTDAELERLKSLHPVDEKSKKIRSEGWIGFSFPEE